MVNKNEEAVSNKEIYYMLQTLLSKIELMEIRLNNVEELSKVKLSKNTDIEEKKSVFYSTLSKQDQDEKKRKESMEPKLTEASDLLIQLMKEQPPKKRWM